MPHRATANRWDVKRLMEYVGWKDMHSALRYLDAPDPYAQQRIEQDLQKVRTTPSMLTDQEGNAEDG